MAKIKWTNIALDDLRAVYDFVAQDSPKYADRLMDKIIERVSALEKHPLIGRKVPEFDDENIGISRIHHSARFLRGL